MRRTPALLLALAVASLAPAPAAHAVDPALTRVTVAATPGAEPDGSSSVGGTQAFSADATRVVFASRATNLVAGDTNGHQDVFVRDLATNSTTRISVSTVGAQGDGASSAPAISADGRYVAFLSSAENLVTGDTNGSPDVFVADLVAGTTRRVNLTDTGAPSPTDRYGVGTPSISADGRFVAFTSTQPMTADDDHVGGDVFVRDTLQNTTQRIGSGGSDPSISGDGRVVSFGTAVGIAVDDDNFAADIYVADRTAGSLRRLTDGGSSYLSAISGDGRFVAMDVNDDALLPGDDDSRPDAFVATVADGTLERVSVGTGGVESAGWTQNVGISADGRMTSFAIDRDEPVPGHFALVRERLRGRTAAAAPRVGRVDGESLRLAPDGRHVLLATDAYDDGVGSASDLYVRTLPDPDADTTPPELVLPAGVQAEAQDSGGATVDYAVSATDDAGGAPATGCDPASGRTFAMGTTTVRCRAVDDTGNAATGTFAVTVADRTPPRLVLPQEIALPPTAAGGARLDHSGAWAHDRVDGAVAPTCTPGAGALLPTGRTTVACVAADGAGNAASGHFDVVVADGSAPALGVASVRTTEGAGRAVLQVARSGDVSAERTVAYTLRDGTARVGADVEGPADGTVTFAAGEALAALEVPLVDDGRDEPLEQLGVALEGADAATLTIVDDDERRLDRRSTDNGPLVFRQDGAEPLLRRVGTTPGDEPVTIAAVDALDPTPSPDGTQVAYVDARTRSLMVVDTAGGTPRRILADWSEKGIDNPEWRPDGEAIGFLRNRDRATGETSERELVVVTLDGQILSTQDVPDAQDARALSWAPNGWDVVVDRQLFGALRWDLVILDTADRTAPARVLTDTVFTDERLPAWSPDGTRIAYEERRTDGTLLEVVHVDAATGGDRRAIAVDATEPAWSPDSRRLAFRLIGNDQLASDARDGGGFRVHVQTGPRTATWAPVVLPEPSREGRVLFSRADDTTGVHVHAVGADGSGERQLLDDAANGPATSADGTTVVFASARDAATSMELYAMTPGGRDVRRLTTNAVADVEPAPFPDGSRVAFSRADGAGGWDVWTVNAATGAERRLTTAGGREAEPAVAPDGSLVAYSAGSAGPGSQLRLVAPDGSGDRALTLGAEAAFAPSGDRLAFMRRDDAGVAQIWTIALDGSDATQITHEAHGAHDPTWSPDGSAIAYATPDGILKVHRDGSGRAPLTTGSRDSEPDWARPAPLPRLTAEDVTIAEGSGGNATTATFALRLSRAADEPASIRVRTAAGTATTPADFAALPAQTVTFAPGEKAATVSVSVAPDTMDEPDETFTLELDEAAGLTAPATPRATATIQDDDDPPAVSVADVAIDEGDAVDPVDLPFTLTLAQPSGWTVRLHAATADATASAGRDYLATAQDVVFAPGQTTATVAVPVLGDPVHEEDETFTLTFSGGEHVVLPPRAATGTIRDDDQAGGEAPETALRTTPGAYTPTATPGFTFASSLRDAPTFECRVDERPFAACTTPHTTRALADGEHAFEVRALNGALADPTPARTTFVVDTVAPSTTIVRGPTRVTRERRPVFTLGADEPVAHFLCAFDDAQPRACDATVTTSADLPDGDHRFAGQAVDRAGNTDASPAVASFRVELTAPRTQWGDQPAAPAPAYDDQPGAAATLALPGGSTGLTLTGAGSAVLPLSCPSGSSADCTGTVGITGTDSAATTRTARAAVSRPATASVAYAIAPGAAARVTVPLGGELAGRVERAGRLGAVVTIRPAAARPTTARVVLRTDPRLPRVLDGGLRVRVRSGTARLRLACPKSARCRGVLTLLSGDTRLASRRIAIRPGRQATVGLRLGRAVGDRLRTGGALTASAVVRAGHPSHTKRVALTLIPGGSR